MAVKICVSEVLLLHLLTCDSHMIFLKQQQQQKGYFNSVHGLQNDNCIFKWLGAVNSKKSFTSMSLMLKQK